MYTIKKNKFRIIKFINKIDDPTMIETGKNENNKKKIFSLFNKFIKNSLAL